MKTKPTREDIAERIERLKSLGVTDRAERKRRIIESMRGATPTPRQSGMATPAGTTAEHTTPAAAVESMQATAPAAPAATTDAAGVPLASMGPAPGPGPVMNARPLTMREQAEDAGAWLGDEILSFSGYDPATIEQHPEAIFLAPASLFAQLASLELGNSLIGAKLAGSAGTSPRVAKFFIQKVLPRLASSSLIGAEAGAVEAVKTKDLGKGAKVALSTTAFVSALDLGLAGGAAFVTPIFTSLFEALPPVGSIRQSVAEQLYRALGHLEQKAPGAAAIGPIGKVRFLTRMALRAVSAGSDPEMNRMFQSALNDSWKTLGAQEEVVGRLELVRAAQDEAQRHFNSLFERELPKKVSRAVNPVLRAQVKQEAEIAVATPFTKAGLPTVQEKSALSAAQEATLLPLEPTPSEIASRVAFTPGTDADAAAAAMRGERRTGMFARAKQAMQTAGATPAEATKLTGAQAEQIAFSDTTTSSGHVNQILGQIRGGSAKEARLEMIRGRARLRITAPPERAIEESVVAASAPQPFDFLSGEEALEEIFTDPFGKAPTLHTTIAQPSGPIESFAQLRIAAAQEGWRVAAIEGEKLGARPITVGLGKGGLTDLPVKQQPTTFYTLTNSNGQEMARAASLTDLRAALRANLTNKQLLIAEPIGELAFADHDDDDADMKRWKFAARNALRAGTILAMAPLAIPEGSTGRAWTSARKAIDAKLNAFLTAIADDGLRARVASRWTIAKQAASRSYFSLRSPEELFRHHPIALPIVRDLSTARRRVDFERNELMEFLTLAGRAGLKPESSAASHAGAILDAVDHDALLNLPTTGDAKTLRIAWRTAAVDTEKWLRSISPEMRDRALLGIDNLTPHQLDFVKKFAKKNIELRDRAKATFTKTFEHEIGHVSPYVIVDTTLRNADGTAIASATPDAGTFVDRFSNKKTAQDYIARRARRIREKLDPEATFADTGTPLAEATDEQVSGLHVISSRTPHRDEIKARFGADQRAYLTRLVHDGAKAGFNVDDIVDVFPQLDPTHIITEMTKLHNVTMSTPYEANGVKYFDRRRAAEAVFGPLADAEYRDLMKQAGIAASSGPAAAREVIVQGVPQRIFVRFYKDRLKGTAYSLDATKALAAYAPAVLRDIHYSPILPRVANSLATLNITSENAGLIRELSSFVDHHLERERSFEPSAMRAMGFLNALTYGGMLWGRPISAIKNIIGQTFLVGMSEMGFDTWVASMRAMADPGVRALLANERIIHHALPIGNTAVMDAVKRVSTAKTPAEAIGAVKDTVGSAGNFMAASERFIRMHAFVGGVIEQMKKNGTLNKIASVPMMTPAGVRPMRDAIKFYQSLGDDISKTHWTAGEDMVRRVAFFFEKSSMPRLYRWGAKQPLLTPALMFTNFGTNYTNRLISNIADAADRRLSSSVRRAAQGKLVRLVSMTALIGGPMALPVVNMLTNEVSSQDPSLGGWLKNFLEPYQAFWQRVYFNRDMQWVGVGAPVADLLSPRRFETAPLLRTVSNLTTAAGANPIETARGLIGLDAHPMVNEEIVKARQRAFGAASPYLLGGAEPPDDQFLPEAVSKHVPGGGAFEDIMKTIMRLDKLSGGVGPLDMRGRPTSAPDNAIAQLMLGRSYSATQDRLDQQFLAAKTADTAIRKNSLIRALVDPSLPAKSRNNAFRALRSNPSILLSLTTDDINRFVDDSQWTAYERRILHLPPEDALRFQIQVAGQLAAQSHMPDQEFQRKSRAMMAATLAVGRARPQ